MKLQNKLYQIIRYEYIKLQLDKQAIPLKDNIYQHFKIRKFNLYFQIFTKSKLRFSQKQKTYT